MDYQTLRLNLKKLKKLLNNKIIAMIGIFQKILKQGLKAIFINETETFYRQYKQNQIGLRVKNNKHYLWWEK